MRNTSGSELTRDFTVAHEIGLHPHPVYNWLGGSPDGITESGKLLEIKCPMMRAIKDEVRTFHHAW